MDAVLPGSVGLTGHDFFARARARLSLDVPAALDDHAAEAVRGDLDLDPVAVGARRREGDPAGRRARSRWSIAPIRRCC